MILHSRRTILIASLLLSVAVFAHSQDSNDPIPALLAAPNQEPATSSIERWDKLSLRENSLHADPPVEGQVDTFADFTRELLRVQWRKNDPIDLYIVRPKGVLKPPVIIYMYGYPGEANRFLDPALCKTVTRGGYAAVSFSSMLTGQRYHDVPMKEWFVSQLQQSLAGTTHDIQMVLNYLSLRGDFDMKHVGIFGEGSGGTIALLAASVDSRIKAVDVLNPWGDWPSWLADSRVVPERERADFTQPDFLAKVAPLDPVAVLPKLANMPLRLQQNLWDTTKTPAISRQHIAAALPPTAQLAQYASEQDYYEKVGHSGKMLDWMYDHLNSEVSANKTR